MELKMNNKITEIIFSALQERNDERSEEKRFAINRDTVLFGTQGVLDSLDLVSTIVDIEGALTDEFGKKVSLSDDRAMSADPIPFTSVATLTDYVETILNE